MKQKLILAIIVLVALALAACAPQAAPVTTAEEIPEAAAEAMAPEVTNLDAILSSLEQPDLVMSAGTGTVDATLEGNTLTVTGEFANLASELIDVAGTPAHIHEAPRGESGPVVFPLEVQRGEDNRSGTISGQFELTDEQVQALRAGNYYVNVHTEEFPAGEIRGQLTVLGL